MATNDTGATAVYTRKYSIATVGGATSQVITHNLNTKDVAPASKETQKQKAKVIVTTTIAVSGTIWAYRPKK